MQMKRQDELDQRLIEQLELIATELEQTPPLRVGYRERVRIERPLFLILKEICGQRLGYVLHGLTDVHKNILHQCAKEKSCSKNLLNFIQNVFEFRIFLLALSSSNPYVQGDALSRASVAKRDAVEFLARQIRILVKEAREISSE